ncbi:MAG: hypothetical protein ACLGHY_03650 [Gammaproteobacteria bacterium]
MGRVFIVLPFAMARVSARERAVAGASASAAPARTIPRRNADRVTPSSGTFLPQRRRELLPAVRWNRFPDVDTRILRIMERRARRRRGSIPAGHA